MNWLSNEHVEANTIWLYNSCWEAIVILLFWFIKSFELPTNITILKITILCTNIKFTKQLIHRNDLVPFLLTLSEPSASSLPSSPTGARQTPYSNRSYHYNKLILPMPLLLATPFPCTPFSCWRILPPTYAHTYTWASLNICVLSFYFHPDLVPAKTQGLKENILEILSCKYKIS